MSESLSLRDLIRRYKKPLAVSLVVCIILVPVFELAVVQRDRNRNMVYGELFWQEGFNVYDLSDQDLYDDYGVPEDHLLTGVLNVTYEYPVVTLLFYAALAAIEPGFHEPYHFLVNWILVLFVHLNLILFLYLGQEHLDRRWFQQLAIMYYIFGFAFSVIFPKVEPFVDLLLLTSLLLFGRNRPWLGFGVLALAFQAKLYPALVFPILLTVAPVASLAFFGVTGLTLLPLVVSGMGYQSLLAHLLNSTGYASFTTNPFFLGWGFTHPVVLLAPAILTYCFLLMVLDSRNIGHIPIPTRSLRVSDWRSVVVYALPLLLMIFSWTQIWYYSWFVVPVLLIRHPEDMKRYRWMIVAIWIAHFSGILLNLEYFLSGPIAELLGHLRSF
ncbi:MAG: hypothetical protein ACFFH0_04495 [Promethearchaeota archaeon]